MPPVDLTTVVQSLGYEDITAFVAAFPGEPLTEVARRLSQDASEIAVVGALLAEAQGRGTLRSTARELLARSVLLHFPNGWQTEPEAEFGRIHSFSSWKATLTMFGLSDLDQAAGHVLDRFLKTTPPPAGWLPQNGHDELLSEVFDDAWPSDDE